MAPTSKRARANQEQAAASQEAAVAAAASDMRPDPDFPGLAFASVSQKGKFTLFKRRPIHPSKFIHRQSMRELGLDAIVHDLFKGVGMGALYDAFEDTYPRLTWEFLSSLRLDHHRTTKKVATINFRLFNRDYSLSLNDFAVYFGLDPTPSHKAPETFDHGALWTKISGLAYQKGVKRNANQIHNAAIRIWHKFMGWTIFAADENHTVRTEELLILGAYLCREPVPFKICIAHHFATHLQRLSNSPAQATPICVGGMITYLAKKLIRGCNFGTTAKLPGGYLSRHYITQSLRWIELNSNDGLSYWLVKLEGQDRKSIPLPNAEKMKLVPNADHYWLELQPSQGEGSQQSQPRVEGQDQLGPTQSSLHYQLPPPIPQSPFATPWYPQQGGSSSHQAQPQPLHPELVAFMADMKIHMDNEEREREIMQRKLDRIYYDQAAADFLVFDDYNRRQFRNPGGHQPSYYLPPDGGYFDSAGQMRYGDFNLNPNYFQGPIFPAPPTSQGEGHDTHWYQDPPVIFSGTGQGDASTSGGGGGADFATSMTASLFGGPPTGDPSLGGGKLMGGAFTSGHPMPMMMDDIVQGGQFSGGGIEDDDDTETVGEDTDS